MHCYRLCFTAPIHIDSRGDAFHERSENFIHSDTLSAALLSAWALLEPENIEQRAKEPPFTISSAFPFYEDRYFLPRALTAQAVKLPVTRLKEAKVFKKVQWLETDLWQRSFHSDWTKNIDIKQGCLAFAQPAPKIKKLWAEEERPRLAIDRITGSSIDGQLFHLSRIWFAKEGGLYFLAKFNDDTDRLGFEAALSLLGDSGIGSDRSNGNGFFNWQKGELPSLSLAGPNDTAVALSLVSPAQDDCGQNWLKDSAYKLVSRGGWIGQSGIRKLRLRMFAEGSVFNQPLHGRVVDITPEQNSPNPVYRDGRGFFVKAG
ncbi:MAG: type III-A CRISPR-associated RAMP protein Csm4 [Methylobacter sp.]|nr:type III-A CRISPR-associated RAMP protein Csm4 [Methylobacter sp.]